MYHMSLKCLLNSITRYKIQDNFIYPQGGNYDPKFTDIGVGTNITPIVHHHGTMANIKPLKQSKGIWIKPKQRTIARQCNLHTCDCTKATTFQSHPSNEPLKVKVPLNSKSHFEAGRESHLEWESDLESDGEIHNSSDSDYDPSESFAETDEEMPSHNFSDDMLLVLPHEERKYSVFESSLLKLFSICPSCKSTGRTVVCEIGPCVNVLFNCSCCEYSTEWASQPLIRRTSAGNLQLSAAILFTGSQVAKVFSMLDAMNSAHQSEKTFYSHQKQYLQPTIVKKWLRDQEDLLNMTSKVLEGDGRSDSPGHSAKYGGFNTIECRINKVIDIQVVQVMFLIICEMLIKTE